MQVFLQPGVALVFEDGFPVLGQPDVGSNVLGVDRQEVDGVVALVGWLDE